MWCTRGISELRPWVQGCTVWVCVFLLKGYFSSNIWEVQFPNMSQLTVKFNSACVLLLHNILMQRKRCRVCKISLSHWFAVARQQGRALLPVHCFSREGKHVPSVTVIFLHTYSGPGIHTWPVNTNQIVSCDLRCCSNLIFCNSYAYLWLTKIVLASVRAVTKANLVRHSSSRFISLSKVFLNKVSLKKHCHAINFPWQMYWLK